MRRLLLAQPATGIESMQRINGTVLRSEFIVSLLALMPLSAAFAIFGWPRLEGLEGLEGLDRNLIVAPGIVCSLTVFLVSIAGHLPMNRRRASLTPNHWPQPTTGRSLGSHALV
jgi:uncharacterized membrane protein